MQNPGLALRCALLGLVLSHAAWTQEEPWGGEGELEDVEIEIVRERQINLPRANRNFEKIPPRPAEPINPEITYDFRPLAFSAPDYRPVLRPLRLKQEEISKIYGNFVSAGYGNYASPYAEAWLTSKRDKEKYYGAHLVHESFGKGPVDGKNSASSGTALSAFGSVFGTQLSVNANIGYELRSGYFYGYDPAREVSRDTLNQRYQIVDLGASLSNTRPADLDFELKGGFSYLSDNFSASESRVSLAFGGEYDLSGDRILLKSGYDLITRKDALVDATPRHLLRINPSFEFTPLEGLTLRLGAGVAIENDTIGSKNLHFYPDAEAQYRLAPSVTAFATLNGDMETVSLHRLSEENLWLDANVDVFHTNRTAAFTTGLRGRLGRRVGFQAGFAAANLKDWYFFQNTSADPARFEVVYDEGNTQRVNFFGELAYNKSAVVRVWLRADYFAYSTDRLTDAWHRPTFKANARADFDIYGKVKIGLNGTFQGGMRAPDPATSDVLKLDAAIDLGLKADYFISKQWSVFVRCNNVLAKEYPLFLNYPVRGFQAKAGLTWAF